MAIRATVNAATYREMRALTEQARKEIPFVEWNDGFLSGQYSPNMLETMVRRSIRLGDLIDTDVLVNRHVLRQADIDPDVVRVFYGPAPSSFALPTYHLIVLNNNTLGGSNQNLYVALAHELTHFKQLLTGEMTFERAFEEVKRLEYHMDRPFEIEAAFWETQQGTKFGWGREEFRRYYERLYGLSTIHPQIPIEKQLRKQAAMPVLTRRPVAVRRYRRRR